MIDLTAVEASLASVGSAKRASDMKAFMKSDLDFIGVSLPTIRKELRAHTPRRQGIERASLLELSRESVESRFFEMRLFGVLMIERFTDLLGCEDLPHIEHMTRRTQAWALVDPLARPTWTVVERCGDVLLETVDRWSNDDNFWVRRLALLCLMPGLIKSDELWDRWVGYAESMILEKEFFIRKAIGWTLREVSKVRPEPVSGFVERHVDVISGVSFREAVKYLTEPVKSKLQAAYKAR